MERHKDRNWLCRKYWVEELSMHKIAKICKVANSTIFNWMNKFNIPKRTISQALSGEKHWLWKGGRKNLNGYILILQANHPYADRSGYVLEQRLVAGRALGRYLNSDEIVHHINGNKADNRNCNLLICKRGYHLWLEKRIRKYKRKELFIMMIAILMRNKRMRWI